MMLNIYYAGNGLFLYVFSCKFNWRKWLIPFSIILICCANAFAQNHQKVSGKVVSGVGNSPLPGVVIKLKNSPATSVTDAKGNFTIAAKVGDVLQFSYVGYLTKETTLGASAAVGTVKLQEDARALKEVEIITVGYGNMRKTDLSSSQVTIGAADIERTINTTIDQALQGRAANVYVNSGGGQPGAAPSVILRGLSSLSLSNQPLYVIDGVQIRMEGDPNGASSNPLAGINPNDIETINVLEGPSATAIYGAAGASGVVLLTTKKGKAGVTKITLNSASTIEDVPKLLPVMNLREWAEIRNIYADMGRRPRDPMLADLSLLGEGTDWQEALFRRTLFTKNTLSLSGGSDKTTFYFSGEQLSQQGVVLGSGFKRYGTSLNLTNQTRSWLKVGTNIALNQRNEVVGVSNADILRVAIRQNPSIPVKDANGDWGGPNTAEFQETNPVALASINDIQKRNIEMRGNFFIDITPLKGLIVKNQFSGTSTSGNDYEWRPSYQFGALARPIAESVRSSSRNYSYNFLTQINYDFNIKKHRVGTMLGHEIRQWGAENVSGSRRNFVTNDIQELGAGDALTAIANSGRSASATEGYFTRLNYTFDNKYIAQVTYRADGSSNFGAEKRWGYFPSASLAWRMSQEPFMKKISAINDLKLRLEWGQSGNSPYSNYTFALFSSIPTGGGAGFLTGNFPNPFLQWERTSTQNIGIDLHMFNNRIELIADAYIKKIDNLITRDQLPYFSGGDVDYSPGYIQFPYSNVGQMKNRGFGITLNTTNIQKGKFSWKTGLVFSRDINKITKLYSSAGLITTQNSTSLQTNSKPGQAAHLFTGYIADGLFQNIDEIRNSAVPTSVINPDGTKNIHPTLGVWVGDIKYRDLNGDQVIDEKDRTVIGNPWPKFTFGINNTFSFGEIDLTMFFTGSFGNEAFNFNRWEQEAAGGSGVNSNLYKSVYNFARPSNLNATTMDAYITNPGYAIPRISGNDINGNNRASQLYVEDASYLRLKTLELGYNIPKRLLTKTGFINGLRLGARAQNLFTLTSYTGYDPEAGISGIDRGRYPTTRMYSLNLIADF